MEQTKALETERRDGVTPITISLGEIDPQKRLAAIPQYQDVAEQTAGGLHQLLLKGGALARMLLDLLHGTWLGHPLHTVLTDFAISAWTFGSLLDLSNLRGGSRRTRRAADQLITAGTLFAVPTALTGITDFSTIPSEAAATGATHGLVNATALGFYSLSLWARKAHRRTLGAVLSGVGFALIMLSAWLGGELSYRYLVGVNRVKEPTETRRWQSVLDDDDLKEHKPQRVEVQGQPVLLYRHEGQIYAIGAVCAHAGGPLEEGCFTGTQVECPWHQSVYDLHTGHVLHGPATYPEPLYETRLRRGRLEIRLAD